MPTFVLPTPTDTLQLHIWSNLLTALEQMFAIETSSAILITTGDPRIEPMLHSMATHIIPDPPSPTHDDPEPEPAQDRSSVIFWKEGAHSDNTSLPAEQPQPENIILTPAERICTVCQNPIPPNRPRSKYCSEECYMKIYLSTRKTAAHQPKGDPRSGDGIVKGTIAHR